MFFYVISLVWIDRWRKRCHESCRSRSPWNQIKLKDSFFEFLCVIRLNYLIDAFAVRAMERCNNVVYLHTSVLCSISKWADAHNLCEYSLDMNMMNNTLLVWYLIGYKPLSLAHIATETWLTKIAFQSDRSTETLIFGIYAS